MSPFYTGAYWFGSLVGRRKTAILSSLVLAIPLTALTFSLFAPDFGHLLFSPICHQNPSRSFQSATALPICSRCLGLYFGFGLAGLFAPTFPLRFSQRFLMAGVFVSLILAGLGLFVSALDENYVRLVLGLAVGSGFAFLVKSILK